VIFLLTPGNYSVTKACDCNQFPTDILISMRMIKTEGKITMNFKKLTPLFLAALFSVSLIGCSSSDSGSNVTGNESPPSLQLSPSTIFNFGTITEGNAAAPLKITIKNTGDNRLDVSSITVSDTNNFQLDAGTQDPQCTPSPSLQKDESCTVGIVFQPDATGQAVTINASLDIASNDPDAPTVLALTGSSEPVSPTMNVTINQVDLANCPTVTAYVSVTDQGDFPIKDLTTSDFDIKEDAASIGSPTGAPNVAIATEAIAIAIVMDNSSSMSAIDIAELEVSALDIVNQLGAGDKVEIIKFDADVVVEQVFTSDKNLLAAAINKDFVGSGTALYNALQQAIDDTKLQSEKRKSVIVITDGNNNQQGATLTDIVDDATASDIPVYVIAMGSNIDIDNLTLITDGTSAELYEAEVAQNLSTIVQQQLSEVLFVDQYILTYTSTNLGAGTHNLTVDATKTGGLSGSDARDIAQCPTP
jgi:VWFA-related protein